ncbi:IPT/TIG domain-containing protein, partial [Modestobacter versicolor]
DSTPGTGTPGTGSGSSPGTGTGSGTGSGPGSGSGATPGSGSSDPGSGSGATDPGTTDPAAPGTVDPGDSTPGTGTTDPGTDPGTTDPGTTDPGTTDPGTTDPGTTDPGTTPGTGGGAGTPPGGSGSPGTGDSGTPGAPVVVTYPEVGPFGITSISPAVVGTAGGTQVTITGTNVPDGVRVRIGDSRAATVVRSSSTSVVFVAPAVVAGVYDVHVFDATATSTVVLTDALTYVEAASGGSTPGSGAGAAPGTGSGGGSTPGPGTGSGGSSPGTGAGGGSAGGVPPVTTVGPQGQRLVRSAAFGSLGASFWTVDCSTSCRGVRL